MGAVPATPPPPEQGAAHPCPEILAPAGDHDSMRAALRAGADAVYFGLSDGFNARARAQNFTAFALPAIVQEIHDAGARAYLTLNTLVFEVELETLRGLLVQVASSGVDALIVQDPGLALLAREICPSLELHASTQMTVSSAEAARFAETLGVTRIVLPRELSVAEIAELRKGTDLELEVFVLGALCVSWSGQCLSSEAWGGRSANRGQCAQACRLPYELLVDGVVRPLGDVAYLLSPRDLAGHRAIEGLIRAGVHTLKIEGRQKGPGYVHQAVSGMRRWVDAVVRPGGARADDLRQLAADVRDLTLTYSRGFGDGFLAGSDHQTLVEGRYPAHRGICVGRVRAIRGSEVTVAPLEPESYDGDGSLASPLPSLGGAHDAASGPGRAPLEVRAGMGVFFEEGRPQDEEQGGPVFAARRAAGELVLAFGQPGPDLRKVSAGARVWVTSDPTLASQAQRALRQPAPQQRLAVAVRVDGRPGEPLVVEMSLLPPGLGTVRVESAGPLAQARAGGLDDAMLRDKLCALGDSAYELARLEIDGLQPGLFVPVSELKALRRRAVELLDALPRSSNPREVRTDASVSALRARVQHEALRGALPPAASAEAVAVVPLCRTDEQLEAAIAAGCAEVILDWMELVGLGKAVARARAAGLRVGLATVRVQKPGEEGYDRRLQSLQPDLVLARHWAAVMSMHRSEAARPARVEGDFSLNVTNSLTASHLLGLGLDTVTAAHDLDEHQLMALLTQLPQGRVAVIVHHHIPTFHTEHCVYANQLSRGRDFRSCGRPCEQHQISLRDRVGLEHPVIVDVGCRNTVFNAQAQTAASLVPRLIEAGVRRLRVEFVREGFDECLRVLGAYRELAAGSLEPAEVVRRLEVHEQFGVTAGTMQVLQGRSVG